MTPYDTSFPKPVFGVTSLTFLNHQVTDADGIRPPGGEGGRYKGLTSIHVITEVTRVPGTR